MGNHLTRRCFLLIALCLTIFHSSQAQSSNQTGLCRQLSSLIDASKTSFGSILGDTMDEPKRIYVSKVELSGWGDGFVHPEEAEGPYVLYVSLGGNNVAAIEKRYKVWVPKLTACLPGWKRTETTSVEDVKSVFRQSSEGPIIQLDYNLEPSDVGDTKFDLYLTITSPPSVAERHFCSHLSTLVDAGRTGFVSIRGAANDRPQGSYASTLKLAAWGNGSVYPEDDEPYVFYLRLGSDRISEVKTDYDKWVSKLTTCLPGWKRTETASNEKVESVFTNGNEGASVELYYNVEPDTVGDTKYDLFFTVTARSAKGPEYESQGQSSKRVAPGFHISSLWRSVRLWGSLTRRSGFVARSQESEETPLHSGYETRRRGA